MDKFSSPLDYAKQPTAARQFFARWRLIVALVIVIIAVNLIVIVSQQLWQTLPLRKLRNKCLVFSLPPTTVIYDEDPLRRKTLLASGKYVSTSLSLGWNPAFALLPVREFDAYAGYQGSLPTAFLHERISPAGHRRLVAANFSRSTSDLFDELDFFANVDDVSDMRHSLSASSPRNLDMCRLPNETVTVYAGQVDAIDMSHFTIDYVFNNRQETIDGWLNDDDSVSLVPRCGDIVWLKGTGYWIPGNAQRPLWIRKLPVTSLGHSNIPPTARPVPMP
jgi:hypothetical protein